MKVKRKKNFELKYSISKHCRISSIQKAILVEWISSDSRFRKRRPTPDELISECKRKGSPLASLMKQTEREAAQTYWRERAQYLLRHIQVVKVHIKTRQILSKPICAYIPIKTEKNGSIMESSYIPAQRVLESPLLKATIVERAHSDFIAWMQRYNRYAEFLEVFSPVLEAYKSIEMKRGKN